LTRLQVITEKVNLKSITRTLPKRPNQIRNWHPQMSAEPDLPKCKREAIVIGTTLDVAEKRVYPSRFFPKEKIGEELGWPHCKN
jgi:hypothetical protein